jgi:hypothetical protein
VIIKVYEENSGVVNIVMEDKEGNQFTLKTFFPAYPNSNLHKLPAYSYAENLANFMGIMSITGV